LLLRKSTRAANQNGQHSDNHQTHNAPLPGINRIKIPTPQPSLIGRRLRAAKGTTPKIKRDHQEFLTIEIYDGDDQPVEMKIDLDKEAAA
jgi:hypothetical protein